MTSILVVEDHPAFKESVERLLSQRGGYEVTTAPTGEQALQKITDHDFDLVLLDISLPGRSGIWLLRAIRKRKPKIPCLMLSGFSAGFYVQQAIEEGARGYVLKDDVPGILDGIQQVL